MKILVTGATGNVGAYVVKELLALGEQVAAAGTNLDKVKKQFGEEVSAVVLDFQKQETFKQALEGVDRVFLMRPPHLGKPEDLYPFIDACKAQEIKLISFLSLMGVEKNTIPPHHKIEKYIEQKGIPYAHVRPGFFMQNLSGIHAEEIRKQNEILVPAGRSLTSFIDAADIGLATALLLHEPERYRNTAHTLTGPDALDYGQVASVLSEVLGRRISYRRPGYLRYYLHMVHNRGLERSYVVVTMMLYLMTRLGTAKAVTDDFMSVTGRQPRTLRQFLEEHQECFQA